MQSFLVVMHGLKPVVPFWWDECYLRLGHSALEITSATWIFVPINHWCITWFNCAVYKKLLDEVFVISRIIKVEVWVIILSLRLRLITLTSTLIILDITKTESNNCFIIHWTKQKKTRLWFFTDAKKNKASELDMITLRNHAPRSYTTWLPVTLTWLPLTLTWLLNNLQLWRHRRGFRKLTVRFRPIRKEIVS